MSYRRLILRNHLEGDYQGYPTDPVERAKAMLADNTSRSMIAGDLRRFEKDQRHPERLLWYAKQTGLSGLEVKAVLDLLFEADL